MIAHAATAATVAAAGAPIVAVTPRSTLLGAAVALVVASVVHGLAVARHRALLGRLRSGSPHSRPGWRWSPLAAALVPAPPAAVVRRLRRAGVGDGRVEPIWRASAGGVVLVVVVATVVGGVGATVLVVALGALGAALLAVAVGDRAAVLVDRELPSVLATVAAGVRSGASLTVAGRAGSARARGPVAEDLREVVDSLGAGRGLVEVLDDWVRARPTPGVRMAGAALALAAETGGAGARTIDGVAATLRDRVAVDRELAALSSQARASAVVIGIAPLGFVVLTATSDPGVWDFFLRTPAGLACLVAGCLLDGAGAGWMMLVARAAR